MLQFLKKAKHIVSNFSLVVVVLVVGCDRDTPVENIDDGRAPTAPTGLRVFYDYDGEVGIEWSPNLEKDIDFYKIFRAQIPDSNYFVIDSTISLFYIDTHLEYDSTYYYKISAVDEFGRESELSDSVSGQPENLYYPFPPYNLTINARNWDDSLSVKISFSESFSTDIDSYEIHRSLVGQFTPDSSTLISKVKKLSFTDRNDLELLKTFYYKIIAVDKGELKSSPSIQLSDMILDKPIQIHPQNGAATDYFAEFKIETCSEPADYKIVIQSNEIYGPEVELDFSSKLENSIISVPIRNITFSQYTEYYWRIYTYTKNNNIPNSFSDLYKFTIVPGG